MSEKNVEQEIAEGKLTIGNFTLQAQMPMGKTITMSGYVFSDTSLEAINSQVDLFHDVIDRQRTRAEIPELEAKLEQLKKRYSEYRDSLAHFQEKAKTDKLNSQEKQALKNMDVNIAHALEDIQKGEEAVAKAKAEVGR